MFGRSNQLDLNEERKKLEWFVMIHSEKPIPEKTLLKIICKIT